jgi:hypothetical protein
MNTSDFAIITRASDRALSARFERSAAKFGLPLTILDGQHNFNDMESYPQAIVALDASAAPYAIVTDAFDVLAARWDPGELAREIEGAVGQVLISGEVECWPMGDYCSAYASLRTTPWSYACGGQFCGRREPLLELMRKLYELRGAIINDGASQELLHHLVGAGYPMSIDAQCRVFQCMRTHIGENVEYRNGLPFNDVTRSWPMFLHFNGHDEKITAWAHALGVA